HAHRAAGTHAGVAFGAALHAALARQQRDVVVVEDFHEDPSSVEGRAARGISRARALGLGSGSSFWPASRAQKTGRKKLGPGDRLYRREGKTPGPGALSTIVPHAFLRYDRRRAPGRRGARQAG